MYNIYIYIHICLYISLSLYIYIYIYIHTHSYYAPRPAVGRLPATAAPHRKGAPEPAPTSQLFGYYLSRKNTSNK